MLLCSILSYKGNSAAVDFSPRFVALKGDPVNAVVVLKTIGQKETTIASEIRPSQRCTLCRVR